MDLSTKGQVYNIVLLCHVVSMSCKYVGGEILCLIGS